MLDAVWAFLTTIGTTVLTLGYLAGIWGCAVVLRKSAPATCPSGREATECRKIHPFHLNLQDPRMDVLFGLAWPLWLAVGLSKLFVKSVEVTDTMPTPTFMKHPTVVQADRQLTAGPSGLTKEEQERLDQEVAALEEEAFSEDEEDEPVVIHEGKVHQAFRINRPQRTRWTDSDGTY